MFFSSKLVINSQEVPQTNKNEKIHHLHVKLTIFMRNLHEIHEKYEIPENY